MANNNYRCPKCSSLQSVSTNKIFDGRLIFRCSKCRICAILPQTDSGIDEAYLDFLERYENRTGIADADDLKLLMEQERIIRPSKEVDSLLEKSEAAGDPLLEDVLRSTQDYVVDVHALEEPPPELGSDI